MELLEWRRGAQVGEAAEWSAGRIASPRPIEWVIHAAQPGGEAWGACAVVARKGVAEERERLANAARGESLAVGESGKRQTGLAGDEIAWCEA